VKTFLHRLFIILVIIYALLIVLYFSQIMLFIILELYEALPIIIPISIMYYCIVDTLTPNPKHSTIYGWFYAETLEHLFLPMTMILILTTIPAIFMLVFLFLIYYFYGHLLGVIKTFRDVIKICVLMIAILVLSFYPDLTLFVNVETGVGYIFIIASLIIVAGAYFIYNILKITNSDFDTSFDTSLTGFFKGYIVSIFSAIATSLILSCM